MASSVLVLGVVGVSHIQVSEGKVNRTYLDPVGIPTICYGHTGPEVRLGQKLTDEQCTALLHKDIEIVRAGLNRCITTKLNQNQSAAVVSIAFNAGVSKICKSTLVRKINAGDHAGAANEFLKWKYATSNGRLIVLPGLVKRREAERNLYLGEL